MLDLREICMNCEHSMEVENDNNLFCTLIEELVDVESYCEDFE